MTASLMRRQALWRPVDFLVLGFSPSGARTVRGRVGWALQGRKITTSGPKSNPSTVPPPPTPPRYLSDSTFPSTGTPHIPRLYSSSRATTSVRRLADSSFATTLGGALGRLTVDTFSQAETWPRRGTRLLMLTRQYSDGSRSQNESTSSRGTAPIDKTNSPPSPPRSNEEKSHGYFIDHLPSIPHLHRPSKEELLGAASGFFSRLRVRFKWASIRSMRPFNNDEIGAFISLIAFGHVIWLFIGTTTFISLAIWAINSIFAQETLAKWVGNYLTQASGLQVVFESAVVPRWGDGVISFHNVFVSRRPGSGSGTVSKGSSASSAAAAAAAARVAASRSKAQQQDDDNEEEDQNYTQFDVTIDTVNVTLSFTKWWNSKGLLQDVEVKGVRGIVDRTHVFTEAGVDPRSYKHEHFAGDFEIENFRLEDLLVTLHQPDGFRPFSVSIYTCELPRLRKQWLFYDFLSANHCSGAYDDSQFNIHPRQMHGHVGMFVDDAVRASGENPWRQHNRLRIDGLNIDHLNAGVEGPFGWINRGNVDIVADVMFPADPDESISKVVADMYGRLEETISSRLHFRIGDESDSAIRNDGAEIVHIDDGSPLPPPRSGPVHYTSSIPPRKEEEDEADRRCIVMDLKVRINDIRASPPAFPRDISYIDNALIRPIVAFLNSRPNWVPINGRLVKRVSDFDGSWTLFDSGLMDEVSEELYNSCVRDLQDSEARARRFRKVGIWSLQLFAQALFIGLVGNIS